MEKSRKEEEWDKITFSKISLNLVLLGILTFAFIGYRHYNDEIKYYPYEEEKTLRIQCTYNGFPVNFSLLIFESVYIHIEGTNYLTNFEDIYYTNESQIISFDYTFIGEFVHEKPKPKSNDFVANTDRYLKISIVFNETVYKKEFFGLNMMREVSTYNMYYDLTNRSLFEDGDFRDSWSEKWSEYPDYETENPGFNLVHVGLEGTTFIIVNTTIWYLNKTVDELFELLETNTTL